MKNQVRTQSTEEKNDRFDYIKSFLLDKCLLKDTGNRLGDNIHNIFNNQRINVQNT